MLNLSRKLLQSPKRVLGKNCLPGSTTSHCLSVASRNLSTSPWAEFEMAPVDPIVGLNEIFHKDDFPSKVIVGVGAYRDDVSVKILRRLGVSPILKHRLGQRVVIAWLPGARFPNH